MYFTKSGKHSKNKAPPYVASLDSNVKPSIIIPRFCMYIAPPAATA